VSVRGKGRTSFAAQRAQRSAEADRWLAGLLGAETGVALVAVGGYGRRELAPGSDLDVLLVHAGRPGVSALADRIWYPVWDSGAHLDHAVRTVPEARRVAASDLKAALGLLHARHIAGDAELTSQLRETILNDWRAAARTRLPELAAMAAQRAQQYGELAFLLEPDLKEARGGLRDVHAIQAVAAAWVAAAAGPRVRAAYELIMDMRHALHEVTGRHSDRLVLQEQDEVARVLGLLDADAALRALAEAGRNIAYSADHTWWQVERSLGKRQPGRSELGAADSGDASGGRTNRILGWRRGLGRRGPGSRRPAERSPLADGVVEQDGEIVLARAANPAAEPVLVLRAAAAAAGHGMPLAPRTLSRLRECPPLPVPWPAEARDALVSLLGAGPAAIPVWEALDQEELITALLPDWERVRNRPQRNPLHTFTVDRHLIEAAARAALLIRNVARPDLLLLAALLHDIGKGWPGDHLRSGGEVARDIGRRIGLAERDVDTLATAVRHHLLLPQTATRRDLDDPVTVEQVAKTVGGSDMLDLLHALAIADGQATGPAAWNDWKASLVADLVRRTAAVLATGEIPQPSQLTPEQRALARRGAPEVVMSGSEVTIVGPDRPGLLAEAAGVLASHRLAVRSATATTVDGTAVTVFTVAPEFGSPPDAALVTGDLRRMMAGRLDVAERVARRQRAYRPRPGVPVAPPKVTLVDDASHAAAVVEVRAHDEPGLLWRIGRALGECGLDVRAARVETLGAEAVDAFYVVDGSGKPPAAGRVRTQIAGQVLAALSPGGTPPAAGRDKPGAGPGRAAAAGAQARPDNLDG
jgi:[protein-PII] uridylyltransferase